MPTHRLRFEKPTFAFPHFDAQRHRTTGNGHHAVRNARMQLRGLHRDQRGLAARAGSVEVGAAVQSRLALQEALKISLLIVFVLDKAGDSACWNPPQNPKLFRRDLNSGFASGDEVVKRDLGATGELKHCLLYISDAADE